MDPSNMTSAPQTEASLKPDEGGGLFSEFCSSALWDLDLTWNTLNPDFTPCFHQTVLTYIPALVILLGMPFQIYSLTSSRNSKVPWTVLNIMKVLLNSALILLPLVDLVWLFLYQHDNGPVADANFVADGVRIILYASILAIMMACKSRGNVTSGPLFIFWLTAAVCGAPTFRSVILSPYVVGDQMLLPFLTYTIQYPFVVALLFLNFFSDARPKYVDLDDQTENLTPETFASFPSKMVFAWFDKMAWVGWKKNLLMEDLWNLPSILRCSGVLPIWDKHWEDEKKGSKKELSILSTLVYSFGVEFGMSAILTLIYTVLQYASPQLVDSLIGFVESDEPLWRGYFYTFVLIIATLVNTIINSQYYFQQYNIGLKVRTALTSAIYRKSLRLSSLGRREMTVGETTNLMAIDTQKFMDVVLYLNMAWSSPLAIILCMYFLWGILGPASMAGLAVMILMIPLNGFVANKMKIYQISQMKEKDRRVKLMDEVLNGIKVLKLYAWEPSFEDQILKIRDGEIGALKKAAYMNAFTTFLWTCAPFLVALSSFTVYVLSDPNNVLDAQTAFVSLTYFNMLRIPLNFLPQLLVYLVQVGVSLKRINKFMNSEELDPNNVTHDEDFHHPVIAENAEFSWEGKSNPSLKDINMKVEEGSLTAVVGTVGSGKSSLLSALLGEMTRTKGMVNVHGKVAYVPQQAWIQNATLQGNITFGKRYNKELYDRVVEACALKTDLEMLPGGDQTEIGEKGINLSGGQKQRVSVARSVYSNGSLYLLDDPLSAVDAHVGKHMFEKVIGPKGLLKNKTRVLVTHGVSFLPEVDNIVVMKDGCITETGSYTELLAQKGAFADFLVQYLTEKREEELDPETESELEGLQKELEQHLGKVHIERQLSKAKSATAISQLDKDPKSRSRSKLFATKEDEKDSAVAKTGQNLIDAEKSEEGGVKWGVYAYYAKSVGYLASIATFLFYVAFQGFSVGSNIWLSAWSDDPLATTDIPTRNMYLIVYGILGLFQGISIMMGTVLFAKYTLNAATLLHKSMLMRILTAPMSFFDTTPLGRILNRFSKDIDIVDNQIPMNMRMMYTTSLSVVGTVFVIVFAMPLFIAVILPVAVLYYFVQKVYVATARQVKRMESVSRSPIYTHFGETISGASTIRAYNRAKDFIEENESRIDRNQICYYPSYVSSRWLSVRLETIGNFIIMFSALFAVLSKGTMDPGLVGLTLSYSLNVTGALNMLVRMSSEVETNMVSVERIQEYQEVPQEAPFEVPENDPGSEWPEHGVVKFDNYQTRYREGLDLVIRGIDFEIKSGEKIGIVGRTGAGKSSMTLALFRIIESAGGSIIIDGVNIAQLGLGKLRSCITIIPQDPVLFAGNMRMNLDPLNKYTDSAIWVALEHAHLKSTVANFPGGLQYQVAEGGENLSVGQRQLICLARALLRKTKVLVLDEATAAVDLETDDLVQATIRREFLDCTVLTIAHRLNTIMDSNRVVVLDAGKVKEFDSPDNLMAKKDSIFYGMAKDAGLANGQ